MKTNSIAAWVFSAVLAIVAAVNTPVVSNRINGWLGKSDVATATAPEPAAVMSAADGDAAGEDAADVSQQADDGQSSDAEAQAGVPASERNEQAGEVESETETEIAALPAADEPGDAVAAVAVPSFGLLRVEPDGSTVIAGQAGANATVEILSGNDKIAEARAAANGDFVAILDNPLAPGDYEIVLRSIEPGGDVAMSTETAIISVPEKGKEGELLALVEQPGEPSRLINTPAPEPALAGDAQDGASDAATVAETPDEGAPAAAPADVAEAPPPAEGTGTETAPEETIVAEQAEPAEGEPEQVAAAGEPAGEPVKVARTEVRIEAVEIDGGKVFVAGSAAAGVQVRVYANEILLGDTRSSPSGSFLVEVEKELPVGDYIIRADVIDPATADVVARAAVPFARNEGERLAAVATDEPQSVAVDEAPAEEVASADGASVAVSVPEPSAALPETAPEVPAGVTVTGQLKRTNSSVIIRRGDTLWHISRRIYGEGVRYTTIYLANQDQIEDPDRIWPGQIFTLPENSGG